MLIRFDPMDNILMHKVLMNEATEMERRELNTRLASDPQLADEFEDLKLFYGQSGGGDEVDEKFYEPLERIKESLGRIRQKEQKIRLAFKASIAVSVSCLIMVVAIYTFNSRQRNNEWNVADTGVSSGMILSANLDFKDIPLRTILQAIEKKSKVVFVSTAEELLTCRFTGTFYKGITIVEVLEVLAESENFQYTFTKDQIVLSGNGCSPLTTNY